MSGLVGEKLDDLRRTDWIPTKALRFKKRDGKLILQQCWQVLTIQEYIIVEKQMIWRDVERVEQDAPDVEVQS